MSDFCTFTPVIFSWRLMSRTRNGWQWIFIIEGILTVIVSLFGYLFITNWPNTARWLNDDEKAAIHTRLKTDSDATNNEGFTWGSVLATFADPKSWLYCFCFHTMSLPLYTLSLFLVSISRTIFSGSHGLTNFASLP